MPDALIFCGQHFQESKMPDDLIGLELFITQPDRYLTACIRFKKKNSAT